MKTEKLKWYVVDKEYVKYLRKFDKKVESIDYDTKLKPYIGIIITINELTDKASTGINRFYIK